MDRKPRIVVGVDGSANSVAALQWAAAEAERLDGTVDAIHAWHNPPPASGGFMPVVLPLSSSDVERAARDTLRVALDEAFPEVVPSFVTGRVVLGLPGWVLRAESETAELLVVGARGHSVLRGLLIGSVAMECVRHAACPVVVVPAVTASALNRSA